MKRPAGATIISGHLSHSLKVSFGFSARSRSGEIGMTSPVCALVMEVQAKTAMMTKAKVRFIFDRSLFRLVDDVCRRCCEQRLCYGLAFDPFTLKQNCPAVSTLDPIFGKTASQAGSLLVLIVVSLWKPA